MLMTSLILAVNIAGLLVFVLCAGVQSEREESRSEFFYLEMEMEMEIPAKKDPGKVRSAKWSVIWEERRIEPKPGTGEVQQRKRRLAWAMVVHQQTAEKGKACYLLR